jgi:hypothetical protein
MMDGSIRTPGLHFQALVVEPQRLLADMGRMGVEVIVTGPMPLPLPPP